MSNICKKFYSFHYRVYILDRVEDEILDDCFSFGVGIFVSFSKDAYEYVIQQIPASFEVKVSVRIWLKENWRL